MLDKQKMSRIAQKHGVIQTGTQVRLSGIITWDDCVDACNKYIDIMSNDVEEISPQVIRKYIKDYVVEKKPMVSSYIELSTNQPNLARLEEALIQKIVEFGILTPVLNDESVDEIQINDYKTIFIERQGKKTAYTDTNGVPIQFESQDELLNTINKLLRFASVRLTTKETMVSTTTKMGYRISATHPSISSPVIGSLREKSSTCAIRKFKEVKLTPNDLIKSETFSTEMYEFMKLIATSRVSVITAGETGSGKSTTNEIICMNIPKDARTYIIQDPTEIQLPVKDKYGTSINNIVMLEARSIENPSNTDPTYHNLIMLALRYTPDKILLGEMRRPEEFDDGLNAALTGHDLITTLHAGSVSDTVYRYANGVVSHTGREINDVIRDVCDKLNFVIVQKRFVDGTRKVSEIAEIRGTRIDANGNRVPNITTIFKYILDGEYDFSETSEMEEDGFNLNSLTSAGLKVETIKGCHYFLNPISEESREMMQNAGINPELIKAFSMKPKGGKMIKCKYVLGGESK